MPTVYLAECVASGKRYVGKCAQRLATRWVQHQNLAKRGGGWLLHAAIRKYGADAFAISVLETCDTDDETRAAEVRWIAELQTKQPNGYNLTDGGEGIAGRARSDAFKMAVSKTHTGRVHGAASRANMSAAHKGYQHTDDQKRKIGDALRGIRKSHEHAANIAATRKGYVFPAEHCRAISEAKQRIAAARRDAFLLVDMQ